MTKEQYEQYSASVTICIVCKKDFAGHAVENIALLSMGATSKQNLNYYLYFHMACLREVAGDQYIVE